MDPLIGSSDKGPTSHHAPSYDVFPSLPPSLGQAPPQQIIETWSIKSPARKYDLANATLVCASWALVISRVAKSDQVLFGVSHKDAVGPLVLQTGQNQTVDYLLRSADLRNRNFEDDDCGLPFQTLLIFRSTKEVLSGKYQETYPLIIEIYDTAEEITFRTTFDSRYLTRWTMERLVERVGYVMEQLAKIDHLEKLSAIDTMTSQDISQIWGWNRVVPSTIERCFHDVFQSVVKQRPGACAISAWDGDLTYKRLDELSTQLAMHLIEKGLCANRNPIAPLFFEKSLWTTVALLGVLKAGGAFLLLDPSLPEKRLKYMVSHVKADWMLGGRSTRSFGSALAKDILVIDDDFFSALRTSQQGLPKQESSSLMYVVFTSGSTGIPKCVKTTHSNVTSSLHYQLQNLAFTESSRVFDFASYSFTTSICNVTFTLASGGCLCVPSENDRRSRLAETIEHFQANLLDLTPSVSRTLDPLEVPSLQTLIFGGEYLQLKDVQRWQGRKVIHLYGQSECCSNSTINHLANASEDALHIGWGAGLNTWIVDPDDHNILLPPGCVGELLFEGPLVAPGYLDNDPARTLAAFIEDPTWLLKGFPPHTSGRTGRLYKTGDLVSYREDGSLNILGRKDTQVKIRGQRVELGEIEHWIRACFPEASEVAVEVAAPKGNMSSKILICFLQGDGTPIDDKERMGATLLNIPQAVEVRLSENLPHYMVPTIFFTLPMLPFTSTGKIDRKTLRSIGSSFSADEIAQIANNRRGSKESPSSPQETILQKVWSQVLGVQEPNIGVNDNFFHLGGDSIAAMKVVGLARKLGLSLAVADLFRHPNLRDLAKQGVEIVNTSQEERLPFSLLNNENVDELIRDIASTCSVEPASIQDIYPCTALQQGLMSLSAKQTGAYMMQEVLTLIHGVSAEDLCRAWNHVANTRPILRTRIVNHHGLGFLQVVLDNKVPWTFTQNSDQYLEADRAQSMGLEEQLVRFALISGSSGGQKNLVITIHHALCDGWTFGLLVEDFYQALQGLKLDLRPQFQAFINYVTDQNKEEYRSFWREGLKKYTPIEFPRRSINVEEVPTHQVIDHIFTKPTWELKNITISTLTQAAWALIIGQMASSQDIVFGVTVSGRKAPVAGIEAMAAPTFATVPLRIQLSSEKGISSFLEMVQEQGIEMIPYEQTGLHNIAKMSPDCQKACDFQCLLITQALPTEVERENAVGTWQSVNDQSSSSYSLMVEVKPMKGKIMITATFDTKVLKPWLVRRLLLRFEVMMQRLSCNGTKTLGEIDFIIDQDLQQIWEWNQHLPSPSEKLIHEAIQERVQAHPNKQAICAWDGHLTYGELNALSDRLASVVVGHGVGPNKLIPLCFEKSLWTPVAVLGVLKAGGGFVLLDPALPFQRLSTIVRQLDTQLILSSSMNLDLCSKLTHTVIEVGPNSIPLDIPRTSITLEHSPSTPVFAVFTSGSTGTPKGIILSHSNFLSGVKHQSQLLGFNDNSRVFDFAGYAFDISVHNVLTALITGGCLCIPSEDDRRDPARISTVMAEMKVTIADLTPSVARLIEPSAVPSLETLILAGEPVCLDDVLPWWGKVDVVNAYGPAECNISTMNAKSSRPQDVTGIGKGAGAVTWIVDPDNHERLLPLGCVGELILEGPIVGLGYFGDPGQTASSFIKSPKWLVNGVQDRKARNGKCGRLYRTGDLVRYLEDGSLAFVGRKDTQIKINGQRVELAEIESCIKEVMDVENVVAEMISLHGEGERQVLAAFLQTRTEVLGDNEQTSMKAHGKSKRHGEIEEAMTLPKTNKPQDSFDQEEDKNQKSIKLQEESKDPKSINTLSISAAVYDKLSERLPVYMRPHHYFETKEFPMTLTGKTDRKKLRELGSQLVNDHMAQTQVQLQSQESKLGLQQQEEQEQEPLSTVQAEMRAVWAKILCIEEKHIDKKASFIQLGGDSISIMKLVSVMRKRSCQLAVRDVFLCPRLEQLVEQLGTSVNSASQSIPKVTQLGPTELSPAQKRFWNVHVLHPGSPWVLMPMVVRLRGTLDLKAFNAAVTALEKRHAVLRTTFVIENSSGMQLIQDICQREVDVVDLSSRKDISLTDALHQDRIHTFDLTRYTGWKITVYRLSETEHVLSITVHRIISDGWSFRILRRDLSSFYSAALNKSNVSITDDTHHLQYRDYASWQRSHSENNFHLAPLETNLSNSQAATFPCDKARPPILSGQTNMLETTINDALSDHIKKFCNQQGVTPFVVLMAAFRSTHCLLTGIDDAIFGTISANRDRTETQDMVGPFESVQCLRINAGQSISFADLVHLVQAEAIAAMDVSVDQVICSQYAEADKDLSCHPLVQVVLVVHAGSRGEVAKFALEGLETEVVTSRVTSRFDLELHVYQEKGALQCVLVMSRDLFTLETGRRIMKTFEKVLGTACCALG